MVGHSAWAGHTGGHSTAGRHARCHHEGHHRGGSLRTSTGTYKHLQEPASIRWLAHPACLWACMRQGCVPAFLRRRRRDDVDDRGGGLNLFQSGLKARQKSGLRPDKQAQL